MKAINFLDLSLKIRRFTYRHIPNNVVIYSKITMDQPVPHPSHYSPLDVDISLP